MGSFPNPSGQPSNKLVTLCQICGKPLFISTAKTDGDGKAVHEDCYTSKIKIDHASQDGQAHAARAWKAIALELSQEHDTKKMIELITELDRALAEQILDGTPRPKAR